MRWRDHRQNAYLLLSFPLWQHTLLRRVRYFHGLVRRFGAANFLDCAFDEGQRAGEPFRVAARVLLVERAVKSQAAGVELANARPCRLVRDEQTQARPKSLLHLLDGRLPT